MKRKQAPVASSSRKRAKQGQTSTPAPHPHGVVDFEREYKIKNILDEKDRQYLIDWEDDEVTGEHYEPSWEPKANANKEAVADWERQKAEKLRPPPSSTPKPKRKPGRPARVILSSPDNSPELSRKQVSQPSPNALPQANGELEPELEIVESQPEPAAGPEEADSPLFEPAVEPSDPPSSFQAGAYQKFSSSDATHSSAPVVTDPHLSSGTSGEQSRSVPVNFAGSSSRVVPDSQSAVESFSPAPAATNSDEVPRALPVEPVGAVESQPIEPEIATRGEGVNEQAPFGPAPQTSSVLPVQQEPALPTTSHLESQESAERIPAAPEEAVGDQATASPAVTRPSAGVISQASAEAPRSSGLAKTAEELPEHLPTATPVASGVHFHYSNGRASDVGTPGRFQTQQSLPSSFPFQTQLARPSTSGSLHSPHRFGSQARPLSTLSSGARASSLPFGQYSPNRSSSPIPSVPSRSIGTLGESAPPRPATPSSPLSIGTPASARIMETSQNSQRSVSSTLAAKLKAISEQGRATRQGSVTASVPKSVPPQNDGASDSLGPRAQLLSQASPALPLPQAPRLVSSLITAEQDRRSPSSVPAMQPLPIITQEEMNTSERYETLVPRAEDAVPGELQRNGSVTGAGRLSRQPTVAEDPQSPSILVVPIALFGQQRDQYQQTLYYHVERGLVERFLAASDPDAALLAEAEHFVERMQRVTMHPDLDNAETLTQYDVEPKMQAQWDVDWSTKFRFLKGLFDGLRDQTLHVAILAQPSRVVDMLGTFLTGITVPHRRLADITETSLASDHDGLMITLVSIDDKIRDSQPSPADFVIAMDPAVTEDCMPIKAFMQMGDRRPPLITLVVPGTVEHVEYSISSSLAGGARLRTLVSGIYQHRNDAGKLEDDQLAPDMAAEAVAQYLAAQDERGEWPLATLGTLADLDSQTESDLEPASMGSNGSGPAGISTTGVKRPFRSGEAAGDVDEASKKARYESPVVGEMSELPMTINPQDIEITHVSDSVHKPTQLSTSADAEVAQQSFSLTDTEQRLQKLLVDAQHRLEEHVEALADLQYRHEEQREKLIEVTNQRDSAILTAQQAVNRMTETANNASSIKADRTSLKQQLEEANAKLLNHSVPERAEFEALRLAAVQAKTEKELLEKRLLSARGENEYFRTNYQTSSQTAQNLASQNTELENELAVARNKATGEQAKLRQMGYDSQTSSLRDENKKLKALLKDRDAGLKFRDEEIARLKEASRGRMGTRGNSVPRSPRLGSPMKMDGLRGRGSRQGSPAAGELRGKAGHLHPLRNG
ncbi:hypothetical protein LTR85_007205 [Meristemomyces frigidus]|nr:hypothetical protein LTR85_007205 [Meristemomyces frigidus]